MALHPIVRRTQRLILRQGTPGTVSWDEGLTARVLEQVEEGGTGVPKRGEPREVGFGQPLARCHPLPIPAYRLRSLLRRTGSTALRLGRDNADAIDRSQAR